MEREMMEKLIEIDKFRRHGSYDNNYEFAILIGAGLLIGSFLPPDSLLAFLPYGMLIIGICFLVVGIAELHSVKKVIPKRLATAEMQYEELVSRKKSSRNE